VTENRKDLVALAYELRSHVTLVRAPDHGRVRAGPPGP
jgi:hypothetical protein